MPDGSASCRSLTDFENTANGFGAFSEPILLIVQTFHNKWEMKISFDSSIRFGYSLPRLLG